MRQTINLRKILDKHIPTAVNTDKIIAAMREACDLVGSAHLKTLNEWLVPKSIKNSIKESVSFMNDDVPTIPDKRYTGIKLQGFKEYIWFERNDIRWNTEGLIGVHGQSKGGSDLNLQCNHEEITGILSTDILPKF